jgi:hypothetical protein
MNHTSRRRGFLNLLGGLTLFSGASTLKSEQANESLPSARPSQLPNYARTQSYRSLKQSSFDKTGGNADSWPIPAGGTFTVFEATGPGVITHIWFTIAAQSPNHLKELVLRIYWDGNEKPSVEVPVGDFFGLNLAQYFIYQSAFLNCASIKALNCYFAMPFRKSARITVTNQGEHPVQAFYSNIDYQTNIALPEDIAYFHAQYRQAVPNHAVASPGGSELNPDGKQNYVFMEAKGKGHLMGVTLGVIQNSNGWFGEGDEMIFIDGQQTPSINGTGTEDYFCGAWDFGGRDAAIPFSHLYQGAPYIALPERAGGRYCLYRWHADNPVTFNQSIKYTIEHGHANDRSDCFYSIAYWYQSEPFTDFPQLPPVAERIPTLKIES